MTPFMLVEPKEGRMECSLLQVAGALTLPAAVLASQPPSFGLNVMPTQSPAMEKSSQGYPARAAAASDELPEGLWY